MNYADVFTLTAEERQALFDEQERINSEEFVRTMVATGERQSDTPR